MADSLCLLGGALGLMLLGLAGAFLPLIPGVPLVWLGATLYGLVDGFHRLSLTAFVILTLLGAIGTLAELGATQIGARAGGASGRTALAGSCVGWLAMFFLSLPLALLAALLSIFGIELLRASRTASPNETLPERRRDDVEKAARGSAGWLAGWALSGVAQFSVSLFMILFFLWAVVS